MKKLAALFIPLALLTGCAPATEHLMAREVILPDGGTVVCVSHPSDPRSGISCDWESAKHE